MVGWVGIWRAELFREGGMVGWLIETAGEVSQNYPLGAKTPSDDRMTLPVRNYRPCLLGTEGHAGWMAWGE
ncbi:MAG: hypothetical protein ACLVCI_06500 [Varibaculum timonense]